MPVSLTMSILFPSKKKTNKTQKLLAINKPTDYEFYLQPFFQALTRREYNTTECLLQK